MNSEKRLSNWQDIAGECVADTSCASGWWVKSVKWNGGTQPRKNIPRKRLSKSSVQRNWEQNQLQQQAFTEKKKRMESILTTARSFNHLHKILFNKRIPKAFIFNAAPGSQAALPRGNGPQSGWTGACVWAGGEGFDVCGSGWVSLMRVCIRHETSLWEPQYHISANKLRFEGKLKSRSPETQKGSGSSSILQPAGRQNKILAYCSAEQSKFVCRNKLTLNMPHRAPVKSKLIRGNYANMLNGNSNNGCLR